MKGELRVTESVLLARAPYRFCEWRGGIVQKGEFKESSCGELNRENLEPKRVGKTSKGMILNGRVASPRLPLSAERF